MTAAEAEGRAVERLQIGAGPPWPWDWAHMSAETAAAMWPVLEEFVVFLDTRYAWTAEQLLPACLGRARRSGRGADHPVLVATPLRARSR